MFKIMSSNVLMSESAHPEYVYLIISAALTNCAPAKAATSCASVPLISLSVFAQSLKISTDFSAYAVSPVI
jgi:hypothetical protein